MTQRPQFLMTDPGHFDVSYVINPWMRPDAWASHRKAEAIAASAALRGALEAAGGEVTVIPAEPGLPDLVFPANAAVVLDRKALLARFRCPERQGEEAPFRAAFERLKARGVIDRIVELPAHLTHEGAGDGLWDETRQMFWVGHGQRSHLEAAGVIARTFERPVAALELATPQFYHLDTCFRPLSGGEVLYYPPAFTPEALATIEANVEPADRIVALEEDAAAFCVNAVCIDRTIVMARAPVHLRRRLEARGYDLVEVDLDPFILSGGAAFCMTLRLDLASQPVLVKA
ncbi:MAG TPA: arginine deiminase-related protein [Phenylobacterium sp.]|nr:arginine deiminase-related protein [Phenylobacterium sp.]